jgi:hypothetical protein
MVASAFALYWIFKSRKLIPSIISLGLIVSTMLVLFSAKAIQPYGLQTYMVFVAMAFVYGFTVKNKKIGSRIIICLMSASIFVYWIWTYNHWHGNTALLPIVTVATGLTAVISRAKLKNELGFLTILAADAVAILLEIWMKAN